MAYKRMVVLSVALASLAGLGRAGDRMAFVYGHVKAGDAKGMDRIEDVVRHASKLGYNGLVFQGDVQDFWRYSDVERKRILSLKRTCDEAGLEFIPAVWSVGYGTMQHADPNLAEGMPIRDVPYQVSADGKTAEFVPEVCPVENAGFESVVGKDGGAFSLPGWTSVDAPGRVSFVDETIRDEGRQSLRFELSESGKAKDPQARVSRRLSVKPHRQYRVSVRLRTEGLDTTYGFQIIVLTAPKKGEKSGETNILTMNRPRLKPTNDWMTLTAEISSQENEQVDVYIGSWHARAGRFWLDDFKVEELGLPDVLRRPGCPFTVTDARTGEVYRPGADYAEIPPLGKGQNKQPVRNRSLLLTLPAGSGIAPGTRLSVSAYRGHVMKSDSQRCTCMSEPALYECFEKSARAIGDALRPRKWFLPMDEIRMGGTCAACEARKTDMAHIFADCVRRQRGIIRSVSPDAEIFMWGDMINPCQNARPQVYMCKGSFVGGADLIPKDITIVQWSATNFDEAMAFFREKGFRTLWSCDADGSWAAGVPPHVRHRMDYVNRDANCRGFMFTTWSNSYPDEKLKTLREGCTGRCDGNSLQSRIDAVAASGGGRVVVPPGRHVVSGLLLRSNVELHLSEGAVLEGAPTTNGYPVVELPCSEGRWMAVVMAVGQTNVAVTGRGEIFGNGTAFPQPANYGNLQEGWRPRGLFFGNCSDIRLEGFRLRDAGSWGCVVQCCERVVIRGLTIDTHANANNDGIDIEARDALIADCDIDSGDDAVCIKSNNPDFLTENILVTNVTARSNCACFKIGTASHGIVRNIRFVDCRAAAPRRDFVDRRGKGDKPAGAGWFYSDWRASIMPPTRPSDLVSLGAMMVECVDGGLVEDVVFNRVSFEGASVPMFVRGGRRTGRSTGVPPGRWGVLRHIEFEDISGTSVSCVPSSITGVPGLRVEDVILRNVDVKLPGGGKTGAERQRTVPELEGSTPGPTMFEQLLPAYGLWARHVDGLTLESVKFTLLDGTSDEREPVVADDVTGMSPKGAVAVIDTDRSDCVYRLGEEATFTVRTGRTSGRAKWCLNNFGDKVFARGEADLSENGGVFTVRGGQTEPGFLRLDVTLEGERSPVRCGVAYEPQRIVSGTPEPEDFDAFWANAKAAYDRDVTEGITATEIDRNERFVTYELRIPTVGGRVLWGYYSEPADAASLPFPLKVEVPGAGPGWRGPWDADGRQATLLVNVHGYRIPEGGNDKVRHEQAKRELDDLLKDYPLGSPAYSKIGIARSREDFFYYGVILGACRAVDWAAGRPGIDRERVYYRGCSQGGGFGLFLTALNKRIRSAIVLVPALTDMLGFRVSNRESGWPRLVEGQVPGNRVAAEANAPYFDGVNFARRIDVPIAFEVGFVDTTCPPHAGYAAYNACPSRQKLMIHGIGQAHAVRPSLLKAADDWREHLGERGDELPLAGRWRLSCLTNAALSCAIDVPGDVHSALFAAGMLKDPYYGRNELDVQWVGQTEWTFSRSFEVDADYLAHRRVELELEDVDTFAQIEVNGRSVGRTCNRFARWTFDVRPVLRPGRNEIKVAFASAWKEADRRRAECGRSYPMCNVIAKNQALIRKPACHAGWDWGLSQMTVGLCGAVRLVAYDDFKVDYVTARQEFNDDLSRCDLTVLTDITEADGGRATVTNRVSIDNPRLWWPAGAGAQSLQTYSVDVRGRRIVRQTGLRKVEVVRERMQAFGLPEGRGLSFRVNGRDLFAKGANWIPCDAFDGRQTPERYRDLLESAKAANMNMLRVWGGGQYERDVFYDTCDELGLMVWQDHMFACAMYPTNAAFFAEVKEELEHQVRRLRDHASIVLWSGDNECMGALDWWDETVADLPGYTAEFKTRVAFQSEQSARLDPTRLFWPSSPCGGPGMPLELWNKPYEGDKHDWRVWGHEEPLEAYYSETPRFCSEFGFQSFPSMEVAETFASRGQILSHGPDFEWHQKHPSGNRLVRKMLAENFRPPKDVPSELLLSQFQQVLAMKTAIEDWRAHRPYCMGILYWQLNDNWPVSGWSSIEYGMSGPDGSVASKWKPAHYAVRRFYAPQVVVVKPFRAGGKVDRTRGTIVAVNDSARALEGDLTVEYWTYDGRVADAETCRVVLPPDSAVEVGSVDAREGQFAHLILTVGETVVFNDWHFKPYKDLPVAKSKIEVEVRACERMVRLSADKPAFFVWANAKGVRGEFSDNCLTLLPGRPASLRFDAKGAFDADAFSKGLSVTSLSDGMKPAD